MEKEEIKKQAVDLISDLRKLIFSFRCFENDLREQNHELLHDVTKTIDFLCEAENSSRALEK